MREEHDAQASRDCRSRRYGLGDRLPDPWDALALSYRLPVGENLRFAAALLWAAASLATVWAVSVKMRWAVPGAYAVLFAGLLVWWSTIAPRNEKDWAPDVRNLFDWHCEIDFTAL